MKIVIIQPSFIPWRGYFHLIERSDIFVFYDDVQYDKHSWRNRNIIKAQTGAQWLTVPVLIKNRFGQKIKDVQIDNLSNPRWGKKIWHSIDINYRKAAYFKLYAPFFEELLSRTWESISELDMYSTVKICELLGIKRAFYRSSELEVAGDKIGRIVNICEKLKGTSYISGPSARSYIESDKEFKDRGIILEFHKYDYPEYPQLYGSFIPQVSIVDLLFNCGKDSYKYIWG